MAAANDLAIANMALALLGDKASQLTAIDNTTELGRRFNACFDRLQEDLLRAHPWPFALKRAIIPRVVDSEITITGATKAEPVVITAASHGFSNGDEVCIYEVSGMTELNGNVYIVANKTTNTFELTDSGGNNIDGTDFTTYTSGGKVGKVSSAPAFGWDYRFQKPSDYLRLTEINGNDLINGPDNEVHYSVEGNEILLNETTLKAQYIFNQTDVTKYDSTFTKLFARYLASELAYSITKSSTEATRQRNLFESEKREAMGLSAFERGTPRQPRQDSWLNERG